VVGDREAPFAKRLPARPVRTLAGTQLIVAVAMVGARPDEKLKPLVNSSDAFGDTKKSEGRRAAGCG
jgi:hypothetical protein